MYRDNAQVITHDDHRFLITHGALGDMICSLPAIVFARKAMIDEVKLTTYVAPWQVELVAHLLAPYGKVDVFPITDAYITHEDRQKFWPDAAVSINNAIHNTHTRNRVSMVDYAFNFLLDAQPEGMEQRSYPNAAPLGTRTIDKPYVVFPQGATSDNKLFKAAIMAPILDWVSDRGYLPVLVGKKISHTRAQTGAGTDTEALTVRYETDKLPGLVKPETKWIDLREQQTLLELRDTCGHATAVCGVDGGTLHLAGTTDTNIVFASGTTLPKHRYVARNGDPSYKIRYVGPRDLECAGCQSNWPLTKLDFRFCAYGDNLCVDKFDPQDFIDGLKELGL